MTSTKVGFSAGFSSFFRGAGFIFKNTSLWGAAATPMVIAVVLMAILSVVGVWASGAVAVAIAGEGNAWNWLFSFLLRLVFGVLALVLAFLFTMALAQPLSSSALGTILRAREAQFGLRPPPAAPWSEEFLRGLRVSFSALGATLPVFALLALVSAIFPPAAIVTVPAKLYIAGMLASWDFLDYPMGARRMDVKHRLAWIREHLGAFLGFSLAAVVALLIPCLGYLMIVPAGVAGAATLVAESERR